MGYDINKHIIIAFTEQPTPGHLDQISTAIDDHVFDSDYELDHFPKPLQAEFRLSGCVSSGFNEVELLDDIHGATNIVEAVSSVDLESPYGPNQFERSEATTPEKHCQLVRMFLEGVQANIQGVLDNVFPINAEIPGNEKIDLTAEGVDVVVGAVDHPREFADEVKDRYSRHNRS